MLMLIRTMVRELTSQQLMPRTPEPSLVMDEVASVNAYAQGGRQGGALSGAYLYHLAHMCRMIAPTDVVLDIGCGPGNLLGQLAELNPRAEFVGLDMSLPMLERARENLASRGIRNVELRHGDMTKLEGIANRSIDVAVSSMAFHHLPDVQALDAAFAQADRVLKPDGAVYFNDFGRLRHPESVRYFVGRAAAGESQELIDDYFHSLHAAFTREEFDRAVARHLRERAKTYSTAISSLQVVIKSRALHPVACRRELERRYSALPGARKSDVRQLSLFMRLGGLNSAL
ncbi:class I SAM-dependent methyltransferase [Paraburkholderia sp. Ac-20347]|uniref:class I SAM-dependent methyltransferase n=1 Tax=Paraburkholderia sp. Ac-20347 TaxID=2703892 RepID=UPI001980FFF1|nr:class I SAM-dependent methyltransferase [Paraburkholderia sp. Ac-20347]MBN3811324.1 class I SAM-dependent methyltransferase [Paraburkholderia sp. Ac-20347]